MALTLSMSRWDDFYLDDHCVIVTEIVSPTHTVVMTEDKVKHDILDDKATEILPDVFVSVGHHRNPNGVRLAIRAPRSIRILTGANYRKGQASE